MDNDLIYLFSFILIRTSPNRLSQKLQQTWSTNNKQIIHHLKVLYATFGFFLLTVAWWLGVCLVLVASW